MAINEIRGGAILSYVSIGIYNIIGLLYTPLMLRMLGQSEYGLYSLCASIIAYLTLFDLGLSNAIVRYTAQYRAENRESEQSGLFGTFFILYLLLSAAVVIIGYLLSGRLEGIFGRTMNADEMDKIRIMFFILIFNLAFTLPMSIYSSIITAYEKFIFKKIVDIIRIVLNTLTMVVLLFAGYKAVGMVVVTTIFNVLTLISYSLYCYKKIKIKISFNKLNFSLIKEIFFYSFWIFLDVIVIRFYDSTGQFILGMYVGVQAVAIYAVAIQFKTIYTSFSLAFKGLFLPRITMLNTKKSIKEISDLFVKISRLQYMIMLFLIIGIIIFGKSFIILWAGTDYELSYTVLLLILIPFTIDLVQNIGIIVLQAMDLLKYRSITLFIGSVIGILLAIPATKYYGIIGCATVTGLVIFFTNGIATNFIYSRIAHLDVKSFWYQAIRMSRIPLVLGVLYWFVVNYVIQIDSFIQLILAIIVFSTIYIVLVSKFVFNEYEKNIFRSFVYRCQTLFSKKIG